ncbi:HD domain-containing protein [Pseudoramibacter alactolyticus]|uniref:HD domain-containing protein n=2 Tax=Pseudoramibacter alactolyticus TaxID=113287 RepID=UPI0028EBCBA8|nr:HD domain-containing protein [Pseudoramibacter alactolyticus]
MHPQHTKLMRATIRYDAGDPKRIQHFIKVHSFAALIGTAEGLSKADLFVLETAAILHDIGIHQAEAKHHSSAGVYQELEGPPIAADLLKACGGYTEAQINRVCFLIGHHHTYTAIDGRDYQILVEADFLVNLYENAASADAVASARQRIFKTATGLALLDALFPPAVGAPQYL